MTQVPDPGDVLGTDDTGAITQHKSWYQAACVALAALNIPQEGSPIVEVYCEHRDDYLMKLDSGKWGAVQVKQRGSDQRHFTANDDDVRDTLVHFIDLEQLFNGRISG